MTEPEVTLVVGFLTAVVTVVGWYATYAYTKRREDHTRRLEIKLQYLQRQIEELYGPLLSLIEQIFNVWEVRQRLLGEDSSAAIGRLDGEKRATVQRYLWEHYFFPLHSEISSLLKTKLYLLEGGQLPGPTHQKPPELLGGS